MHPTFVPCLRCYTSGPVSRRVAISRGQVRSRAGTVTPLYNSRCCQWTSTMFVFIVAWIECGRSRAHLLARFTAWHSRGIRFSPYICKCVSTDHVEHVSKSKMLPNIYRGLVKGKAMHRCFITWRVLASWQFGEICTRRMVASDRVSSADSYHCAEDTSSGGRTRDSDAYINHLPELYVRTTASFRYCSDFQLSLETPETIIKSSRCDKDPDRQLLIVFTATGTAVYLIFVRSDTKI